MSATTKNEGTKVHIPTCHRCNQWPCLCTVDKAAERIVNSLENLSGCSGSRALFDLDGGWGEVLTGGAWVEGLRKIATRDGVVLLVAGTGKEYWQRTLEVSIPHEIEDEQHPREEAVETLAGVIRWARQPLDKILAQLDLYADEDDALEALDPCAWTAGCSCLACCNTYDDD